MPSQVPSGRRRPELAPTTQREQTQMTLESWGMRMPEQTSGETSALNDPTKRKHANLSGYIAHSSVQTFGSVTPRQNQRNVRAALANAVKEASPLWNDPKIRKELEDGDDLVCRTVSEKALTDQSLRSMGAKSAAAALRVMRRKEKKQKGARVCHNH